MRRNFLHFLGIKIRSPSLGPLSHMELVPSFPWRLESHLLNFSGKPFDRAASLSRQIDALVRCGQSPFNPSVLRAATASFLVFLISCIASAMALVVIIAPGFFNNFFGLSTLQALHGSNGPGPHGLGIPMERLVVAVHREYPGIGYLSSPVPRCSLRLWRIVVLVRRLIYRTSIRLHRREQSDELHRFLHAQHARPYPFPSLIWSGNAFDDFGGKIVYGLPVGVSVLTQDLVKGVTQANNCTAYNATYEVGVTLQGESTSCAGSGHDAALRHDEQRPD